MRKADLISKISDKTGIPKVDVLRYPSRNWPMIQMPGSAGPAHLPG
jgi:hypothetical protein